MMSEMISAKEAADILGVSPSVVRVWIRAGVFKTAKKVRGTRWLVSKEEVEEGPLDVTGAWGKVYG